MRRERVKKTSSLRGGMIYIYKEYKGRKFSLGPSDIFFRCQECRMRAIIQKEPEAIICPICEWD